VISQVPPRCATVRPSSAALPAQEFNLQLSGFIGGTWFAIVSTPNGDFELANLVIVR
jgi:hypothetical protein